MKCKFIKPDNNQCNTFALRGKEHCFRHDPESQTKAMEASRKGGSNKKGIEAVVYGQPVVLKTPADIRTFLGGVISQVWTGKTPPQLAGTLGFLTRCWLDSHEAAETDNRLNEIESRLEAAGL